MESERGPTLDRKSWPVDRPELVIKCVCSRCNNGWMSQLQERGKPIIERLWTGGACALDLQAKRTLSSWAVMTSMVLQTLDERGEWLYSEFDRTVFWTNEEMPSFMGIWIAQCVGYTSMSTQGRSMSSQSAERRARAHVITMAFGTLGLQVLKVNLEGSKKLPKDITVSQGFGDWENIALQIWPLKGAPVTWPPPRGIRCEPELEQFAGRFRSRDDPGGKSNVTIVGSADDAISAR
jgi:hypothetical protein